MKGYDLTLYEILGRVKIYILVIRAQQFLLLSLDNLKLMQVSAGSEYSEEQRIKHVVLYSILLLHCLVINWKKKYSSFPRRKASLFII